jgi:hypothetical protein
MSDDEHPRDLTALLAAFYRGVRSATSGKHTSPGTTALLRLAVLLVGLACAGPILWHALGTMPAVLVVFIVVAVAIRVGYWYFRRQR